MKLEFINEFKIVFTLFFFCFFYNSVPAQQKIDYASNRNLSVNKVIRIGKAIDSLSLVVSDDYDLPLNEFHIYFLQLSYKNVPVFGKIETRVSNDDQDLKSIMENSYSNLVFEESKGKPCLDANNALMALLQKLNILNVRLGHSIKTSNHKLDFGKMGISETDIIVQKMWYPIKEENYVLAWQIELTPQSTTTAVVYWLSAYSLDFLASTDYTVEESLIEADTLSSIISHDHTNETEISSMINLSANTPLNAAYSVSPYPFENSAQSTSILFNPWMNNQNVLSADYSWHFDGYRLHDSTRGNNVWVQEDLDNNNLTRGRCALSQTPLPSLSFLYSYDSAQSPLSFTNQQYAFTNLFYWCNFLHDFFQTIGFDEASGNFQFYNYNNGLANDGLIADAQDAGRFNNANFTTPPDGISPRMQLYLFNKTIPMRDASLDNGIIIHEYTHGVANRLTGGPSAANCLSNSEQPGEGWSDYFALMLTTDWRNAGIEDGAIERSIGTYVLGQQKSGKGIRDYYYSTNKEVNPLHYGMMATMEGNAHKIGEIWCATLWDLTWLLVRNYGIDSNMLDPFFSGGNTIAMKLILEGMRLQPCSPGFLDSRNAILLADTLFFQGKYSCLIWKAFAGRGMGFMATQGSTNNTNDQTESFSEAAGVKIKSYSNVIMQHEGMNVRIIHRIVSGNCNPMVNYKLTDTLPLNATYVEGGNFDSTSRTISFSINLGSGETAEYSFIYKITEGAYYPKLISFKDSVSNFSIDSFWNKNNASSNNWMASNLLFVSPPHSFFSATTNYTSENILTTKMPFQLPVASAAVLTFNHQYQMEAGWDGGVVELSSDNGSTWIDLGPYIITEGYDTKIKTSENPLSGRFAFTGISTNFKTSRVDLSFWEGKSILIRFRMGTDESISLTGWYIDDIMVKDSSRVLVKAALSDHNNFILAKDKIAIEVMPALVCSCFTLTSNNKREITKQQKK